VTHEKLGIVEDGSTRDVVLTPVQPVEIAVFVPPVARFARTLCGRELANSGQTGIIGIVHDANRHPTEGAVIHATWFTQVHLNRIDRHGLETKSISRGIFTFCGLPPTGVTLEVDGVKTSVRLERGRYQWVELVPRP
jgi:hypothetical protein